MKRFASMLLLGSACLAGCGGPKDMTHARLDERHLYRDNQGRTWARLERLSADAKLTPDGAAAMAWNAEGIFGRVMAPSNAKAVTVDVGMLTDQGRRQAQLAWEPGAQAGEVAIRMQVLGDEGWRPLDARGARSRFFTPPVGDAPGTVEFVFPWEALGLDNAPADRRVSATVWVDQSPDRKQLQSATFYVDRRPKDQQVGATCVTCQKD